MKVGENRDDLTRRLPLLRLGFVIAIVAIGSAYWFVQVVHYPLFSFAATGDFTGFAAAHQHRTSLVVAPLMVVELATAAALALPGSRLSGPTATAGLLLAIAIWASTALLQVPLHRRLAKGFDSGAARLLVGTNWLRTGLWSARSVIAEKSKCGKTTSSTRR